MTLLLEGSSVQGNTDFVSLTNTLHLTTELAIHRHSSKSFVCRGN